MFTVFGVLVSRITKIMEKPDATSESNTTMINYNVILNYNVSI